MTIVRYISCLAILSGVARAEGLAFDSLVHDFGTIFSHESYSCTFPFRNAGKVPVRIKSIKTSCSCTAASPVKETFGPGERGQIDVTLNTEHQNGEITKTIMVETDTKDQGQITLTLKAHVLRQGIRLSPRRVVFGTVHPGEPIERGISAIILSRDREIRITKVIPSAKWLRASYEHSRSVRPSRADPRHGAAYLITLRPDLKKAPIGPFLEFVTIYTDSERFPFADVEVRGRVGR